MLLGTAIGVTVGNRLPERTRILITDALGLITLVIGARSLIALDDSGWQRDVGSAAPLLIVLGAVVLGGLIGSALRLEDRLEGLGEWLRRRLGGGDSSSAANPALAPAAAAEPAAGRERFVAGFVTASLVFCVGPLTILGSLTEGLGNGAEQLVLKSVLDGFAAIAFAAAFGVGVAASVVTIGVIQGGLTLIGFLIGDVVSDAALAAVTATGGLILLGVGLRLLAIRQVRVGDLLPALALAPVISTVVTALR